MYVNPCKGCEPPKRSVEPNCHSCCTEYLEWRRGYEAEREKEREERKKEQDVYTVLAKLN
jgi:hypothetical protein